MAISQRFNHGIIKEIKMNFRLTILIILLFLFFAGATLSAQENNSASVESLSPFSRLIGGEWHLEGSYQVFEWGIGKMSVKANSYFIVDGKPKLVSEGFWFWHPGEKKIKGYFTAIEMPVAFFDYTISFQGNKMVNQLKSYSPQGKEDNYIETWEFTDNDHYVWTLFSKTPEGKKRVMGGTYSRKFATKEKESLK